MVVEYWWAAGIFGFLGVWGTSFLGSILDAKPHRIFNRNSNFILYKLFICYWAVFITGMAGVLWISY